MSRAAYCSRSEARTVAQFEEREETVLRLAVNFAESSGDWATCFCSWLGDGVSRSQRWLLSRLADFSRMREVRTGVHFLLVRFS